MNMYCDNCKKVQGNHEVEVERAYMIQGEPVTVRGNLRLCCGCAEEIHDEALEQAMLEKAYYKYLESHQAVK